MSILWTVALIMCDTQVVTVPLSFIMGCLITVMWNKRGNNKSNSGTLDSGSDNR